MKRNLLYLFLFPILNFGQVIVDSIHIDTQFYGPFNNTRTEITLYNNSEIDSVEGRFEFKINTNAFVKDMWLEIDGEFKKASTLRRSTGQRIYQRITRKRIDPALLTGADGNYLLRVFPFQSYQKRKVIIEYFSIVEYDALGKLRWSFSSNSQERFSQTERGKSEQNEKNTIRLKSYQPLGTKIKVNNSNLKQSVCLRSKDNDSIKKINSLLIFSKKLHISFDYSSIKNKPIYFSDSTKYYQVIDTLKKLYNLDPQYIYPPEILSKIIDDVKNADSTGKCDRLKIANKNL